LEPAPLSVHSARLVSIATRPDNARNG
jgi:hypothetical protein